DLAQAALAKAEESLPELERQAKEKLSKELMDKLRSSSGFEAQVRATLEQEVRERLQAAVEADVERSLSAAWAARKAELEAEHAKKEQELRAEQAKRLEQLKPTAPPGAPGPPGPGPPGPGPPGPGPPGPLGPPPPAPKAPGPGLAPPCQKCAELQEVRAGKVASEAEVQKLQAKVRELSEAPPAPEAPAADAQLKSLEEKLAKAEEAAREQEQLQAELLELKAAADKGASGSGTSGVDAQELARLRAESAELKLLRQRLVTSELSVKDAEREKEELQTQLEAARATTKAEAASASNPSAGADPQESREAESAELKLLRERLVKSELSLKDAERENEELQTQLEAAKSTVKAEGGCAESAGIDSQELARLRSESAELKFTREKLQKAEASIKEAESGRDKIKTELDMAKRELDQAKAKEVAAKEASSKSEASLKEALAARLESQQESAKLKASGASFASEKAALVAQVGSLEAQLKGAKTEDGVALALRKQVAQLEEELAKLRLLSAQQAEGAVKLAAAEARASEAERTRATLEKQLSSSSSEVSNLSVRLKEAQLAECELQRLKPRLQDAEQQVSHFQKEIAKRDGEAAQAAGSERAREKMVQQLKDEVASLEASLKRLKSENSVLEADRADAARLKREVAILQQGDSEDALRAELRGLRAEAKEKDLLQIRSTELNAQLAHQRAAQSLLETSAQEAKEQVKGLRGELQEQRATAAEDARRLRSELWEERSAAAAAAVASAGELASLRASQDWPGASSPRQEAQRQEEVRALQKELRVQKEAQETQLRGLLSEAQAAQAQLSEAKVEEELALRRAREETRQARERLCGTEAALAGHEERQRRQGAELDQERQDGDQRVQRVRQELRRLEQEADEAALRARLELRRKDEQVAELEKDLRSAQRQLAAKDAELVDTRHLQEAKVRSMENQMAALQREEAEQATLRATKLAALEEKEGLRNTERLLRQKEAELEGTREMLRGGTWPSTRPKEELPLDKAASSPSRCVDFSPDVSPEAEEPGMQASFKVTDPAVDAEIEQMLVATLKPQAWPEAQPMLTTQAETTRAGKDEDKGLLELAQKRRRQLKKQRAALLVDLERWRLDASKAEGPKSRQALVEVKHVLDQQLNYVMEGLRESKVVERTLLGLHEDADAAGARGYPGRDALDEALANDPMPRRSGRAPFRPLAGNRPERFHVRAIVHEVRFLCFACTSDGSKQARILAEGRAIGWRGQMERARSPPDLVSAQSARRFQTLQPRLDENGT
ncbi:unnamed protein product, partial [Effrenium voratum]